MLAWFLGTTLSHRCFRSNRDVFLILILILIVAGAWRGAAAPGRLLLVARAGSVRALWRAARQRGIAVQSLNTPAALSMAAAAAVAGEAIPLVKICGTQDADSAVIATKAGADFIGMIFVPKSK
eukprot:COSAG02_NODE_7347_length_3053_cov_4.215978_5_plen_124_part_00